MESLLEVECPGCAEVFVVPAEVIEDCQRMLAEHGHCIGPASYECPVPYFASLACHGPARCAVTPRRSPSPGGAR
ncbi:MAG: hypothetical protein JNL83_10265 [Myxococcales bacterium]|nr:hypothetical protein [Myxococcales bacterium]